MWSYHIVDTLTGVKQQRVFPSAGHGRTTLTGIGDGEHSFELRDPRYALPREKWQDLATEWARTVVVSWSPTGGFSRPVARYAGIITGSTWDAVHGVLTLHHAELRTIFSRRLPFQIGTYDTGTLTLSGKSLRGLICAIVKAGAQRTPGDPWHLPISYPAEEAGTESRTWLNYNFRPIDDLLAEVENAEFGPDTYFQSQWTAEGTHEWDLRIGDPVLAGAEYKWPLNAERSGALDATFHSDGTKQLTGVFALGDGEGEDMPHGEAGHLPGPTIPYLDARQPFKAVENQADLDSLAMGVLRAHRYPTKQASFNVLASGYPGADKLDVGVRAKLQTRGDEFIDDGWLDMYLIGYSFDMTHKLTLELQSEG